MLIDGKEVADTKNYTFKKVNIDYKDKIIGVWEGKDITPGTNHPELHRWEYLANGRFNYYYQDENKEWVLKEDNNSKYFLYGDLMVTMWTNDYNTDTNGTFYENWWIQISGDTMNWDTFKKDGSHFKFEMIKVK